MSINVNMSRETLQAIGAMITYCTWRREWEDFKENLSERLDEEEIEHDWEDWVDFDSIPAEFLKYSDHIYKDACLVNEELRPAMLEARA